MILFPGTLEKDDENDAVGVVQQRFQDRGLPVGKIDNDFGGKTQKSTQYLQQAACIPDHGRFDALTDLALKYLEGQDWKYGKPWRHSSGIMLLGWRHPKLALIPDREGRTSSFGGPDDKGDRRLTQGRLNAKTAAHVYARYPELVRQQVFRPGLTDPLPNVFGVDSSGNWGTGRAGVSWMLDDENGMYSAMRWRRGRYPNPRKHRVAFFYGRKTCVVIGSDYGPSKSTKRNNDLSPAVLQRLGAKTDSVVQMCWAADDHDLGLPGEQLGLESSER